MAKASQRPVLASVIDRLIDEDPDRPLEAPPSGAEQLRQLRNSLRRDLEALFNTRQRVTPVPADLPELQKSVYEFGVPDLTGMNLSSQERRLKFLRVLEGLLRKNEPRFKTVKITPQTSEDPLDRTLRFRIDALMYAEPAPEAVVFDSRVEPVSRSFQVKI